MSMQLPGRNDIMRAVAFARAASDMGQYSPSMAHTLMMLQDDPTALIAALTAADVKVSPQFVVPPPPGA